MLADAGSLIKTDRQVDVLAGVLRSVSQEGRELVSEILRWVVQERLRQRLLFGTQHHSPQVWCSILAEELGEAAREANRQPVTPREYQDHMLHIATVAVAALEDLGIWTPPACHDPAQLALDARAATGEEHGENHA